MAHLSERVLILAVTQKDAVSTCEILSRIGLDCFKCADYKQLSEEISNGAGAIILAKEALNTSTVFDLASLLDDQPPWSFLPIIMLIGAGDLAAASDTTLKLLRPLRNTTLLERPVRITTLASVVQAAIADRRRQYEVRDLLSAVEKSKHEAIKASQAKSTFLANMSHEIRTPLGVILGFSELMMDPSIDDKDKKSYLTTIKRNGQLLSILIDDILDLAKVEAGKVDIETLNVSIDELIAEVISGLEPRATVKGIPLKVTWDKNVPRFLEVDPIRLKQVVINVVSNAIKFTQSGEVRLHIYTRRKAHINKLFIDVTDTGVGISESQAAKLFQPFTQADNSITRKFGGTGLGLVLSKKLAQAHGGDLLLAKSEPGKGSTFEISVTYTDASSSANASAAAVETINRTTEAKLPLLTYRVLLADDSRENQVLIGRMLTISGAQVETASDGVEAMEKALLSHYDMILMDMQMPLLGGHEATSRLRKQGYTKPIIALTAHALPEDRAKCINAGCDDYLTKPVQWGALVEMVASHIKAPSSDA